MSNERVGGQCQREVTAGGRSFFRSGGLYRVARTGWMRGLPLGTIDTKLDRQASTD